METVDIIKEFTEEKVNTQSNTNVVDDIKNDVVEDAVKSVAPESIKNDSAFDALLTGKSNIVDTVDTVNTVDTVVNEEGSKPVNEPDTSKDDKNILDEDEFIKSKTEGKFENWDQLVQALNTEKKPKFENEVSEKVYNMLLEGKTSELYEILEKKHFAENLQKMDDEQVLKAYIKATNPEFDENDIEDEYTEKYTLDEFDIDESKLKREQKKLSQRLKGDVVKAKGYFESLAQDIKLPELSKAEKVSQSSNEDAEMERLIQEQRSAFIESLKGVEAKVSSLPFQWKDEKANVSVNGKFDIPAQELSKYKQAAEDLENYQVTRYFKDGKYLTDRMVKDLYIADNFDKILNSAISQAVNQTKLEMLKNSKNIQTNPQPTGTFQPNAADEQNSLFDKLFMGHLQRQ